MNLGAAKPQVFILSNQLKKRREATPKFMIHNS
jgi:hypothetical protein